MSEFNIRIEKMEVTKVEVTNLKVTKMPLLLQFATKINFASLNFSTINQNAEYRISVVTHMPE